MTPMLDPSQRVDALVAGTLCLMSCFANAPQRFHADRIARNLAALSTDACVSAELRSLCRRLGDRWEAIADRLAANEPFPMRH